MLTEIVWQLERKWKYGWSCGKNRAMTIVAKIVTLLVALSILYISIFSALDLGTANDNAKLNFMDKSSLPPEYVSSGSAQRDHYYAKLSNYISNGVGKDGDSKHAGRIATQIINTLGRNFHKADKDGDGLLDKEELTTYISNAIAGHLSKAMKDNFDHYFKIDTNPRNGLVSWEEYLLFFFNNKSITGVTADDVLNRTPPFQALPKNIKVEIARIQASWSEAATNNPDYLTVDEFLAFEHPEASPSKIISNVDDIFVTFDLDADDIISEQELATTYKHAEGVDPIFKRNKHLIDTDRNGQISRIELMRYMNPRSIHHSKKDAVELIKSADKNLDGRLSLLELVKSANIVVMSKFYDVEKNLHTH